MHWLATSKRASRPMLNSQLQQPSIGSMVASAGFLYYSATSGRAHDFANVLGLNMLCACSSILIPLPLCETAVLMPNIVSSLKPLRNVLSPEFEFERCCRSNYCTFRSLERLKGINCKRNLTGKQG